ncbi:MAG: bifunctional phosphopantothenoylcysteine decarboxylase/phosphopantothenate--cysteine ligase CoaBC [Pseudomonadota bacterium]
MTETRRILLIIGGGIAAYKSLELIRALRQRGFNVSTILTKAGEEFVTKLSVSSLSGEEVFGELFDLTREAKMGHIELSRNADLVVVAPATADLMAKRAHGLANDLASTALLATDKRVLLAPAMNVRMWEHAATQRNIAQLKKDGCLFVGPNEGDMACGEFGLGRMAEPLEIVAAIESALQKNQPLQNRHVIITAGPTFEPIDPVRFLGNRSSGKQGYALAQAAVKAGARVTLISGPVHLDAPHGTTIINVETAQAMQRAVEASLPADVFIASAAVSDWRANAVANEKIKKRAGEENYNLQLVENPDILASVAKNKNRPALVIGFAAETENVLANAQAKRTRKGCDWIVANDVSNGKVFGENDSALQLVTKDGVENWPLAPKSIQAEKLIAHIAKAL